MENLSSQLDHIDFSTPHFRDFIDRFRLDVRRILNNLQFSGKIDTDDVIDDNGKSYRFCNNARIIDGLKDELCQLSIIDYRFSIENCQSGVVQRQLDHLRQKVVDDKMSADEKALMLDYLPFLRQMARADGKKQLQNQLTAPRSNRSYLFKIGLDDRQRGLHDLLLKPCFLGV